MRRILTMLTPLALLLSCSGAPPAPGAGPSAGAGPAAGKPEVAGPVGTARIEGRCVLAGTAPADKAINMAADPKCAAAHATPPVTDNFTVNADGSIPGVMVSVKNPPAGTYEPPPSPALLDQKGCMYQPKVLGIMTGQPLKILNSDATLHNVHALPTVNKEFNLGMPTQGMSVEKTFTSPEQMVKFKCDVHPWMFAYVGVMSHPFFAATGDAGSFVIDRLPAGKYTIEAWHNKYGTRTLEVELADGESESVEISFTPPA